MTSRFSHRTLAIAAGLIMVTSLWGGLIGAQDVPDPTVPPLPINEGSEDCVPFTQSPLSLKDIDGVKGKDEDKFINPQDLDGDGFSNAVEFLQRSDPTDDNSTPLDRDADGTPSSSDPCDYNPNIPAPFDIALAVDDEDERINRTESFTAIATVTVGQDEGKENRDVERVELTITLPDGSVDGPFEMTNVGVGVYEHQVDTNLDSQNGEWILDATAFEGTTRVSVRDGDFTGAGDERLRVNVDPMTHAPAIELLNCTTSCDTAEDRERFFLDQKITVRAFPDAAKIDLDDDTAKTAVLKFTVTNEDGDQSPEFEREMTLSTDKTFWQAAIDPADPLDNPFVIGEDVLDLHKPAVTYDFTVEAEDDASEDPNTALNEAQAAFEFIPEFRLLITKASEAIPRGGTIEFIAELQKANPDGDGWITEPATEARDGIAIIRTAKDDGGQVVKADVSMDDPDGDGIFVGEYSIGLGDHIETDEFGDPVTTWFVRFEIEDAVAKNIEYAVEPAEVPATLTTNRNSYLAVIDENNQPAFIDVMVWYKLEGPAFDGDDADDAPGEATARVLSTGGAPIASQELQWQASNSTFFGTVQVPTPAAVAAGGAWTVRVDHADDARDAPNRGSDSKQVVGNADFRPGGSTQNPARANIQQVAASNTPSLDQGLTGDDGFDHDFDAPFSHRYIIIEGVATPQEIVVDGEVVDTRRPTMVGLQFNDFNAGGADVYFSTPLADGQTEWTIVIDTQRYCADGSRFLVCDNLNGFTGDVPINAFAYTGPVASPGDATSVATDNGATFYVAGDPTGTYGPLETQSFRFEYVGPTDFEVKVLADGPNGAIELGPGANLSKPDNLEFRLAYDETEPFLVGANGNAVEFLLVRARYVNCFKTDAEPLDSDRRNNLRQNEWCIYEHYRPESSGGTYSLSNDERQDGAYNLVFDSMQAPNECAASPVFSECTYWKMNIKGPLEQGGDWPSNNERFWVRVDTTNILGYNTFLDTPNMQGVAGESGSPPDMLGGRAMTPSTGDFGPDSPAIPGFGGPQFTYVPHEAYFTKIGPFTDWRADESSGLQRSAPEPFTGLDRGDAYWDRGETVRFSFEDNSGNDPDYTIMGLVSAEAPFELFGDALLNAQGTNTHYVEDEAKITIDLLASEAPGRGDETPLPFTDKPTVTVVSQKTISVNDERLNDGEANDISWSTQISEADLITWAKNEMIDWLRSSDSNGGGEHPDMDARLRLTWHIETDTGIEATSDTYYVEVDVNAFPDAEIIDGTSSDPLVRGEESHTLQDKTNAAGPSITCTTECTLRFKVFDLDGINHDGNSDDAGGRQVDGLEIGPRVPESLGVPLDTVFFANRNAFQWLFEDLGEFDEFFGVTDEDGNNVAAFYTATVRTVHPDEDKKLPTRTSGVSDEIYPDGTHRFGARSYDGVEIIRDSDQSTGYRPCAGVCVNVISSTNQPIHDFRLVVDNDADGDGWSNEFEDWVNRTLLDSTYRGGQPFYGQVDLDIEATNGLPLYNGTIDLKSPSGATSTVTASASTPCDFDGDGIPNDVDCLGILNLEELFHTHPFLPDSFMDDPNQNNLPNFMDPFQTYRFDCADNDFDGHCNEDEQAAGSDPDNPQSVPGDTNGNQIPDDIEDRLSPISDADGDGYGNWEEIARGSDPLDDCSTPENTRRTANDWDGDGISNFEEVAKGSDPLDPDDPNARNCPP